MATMEEMLRVAEEISGGSGAGSVPADDMLKLAEDVTNDRTSIADKLSNVFTEYESVLGPGGVLRVTSGKKGTLGGIVIRPKTDRQRMSIQDEMVGYFGPGNVVYDRDKNELHIKSADEIGKNRLAIEEKRFYSELAKKTSGEIPYKYRLGVEAKETSEGKRGYLEHIYGKGSVYSVPGQDGNFHVFEDGKWKYLDDKKRSNIGDVIDIAKEAGQALAGAGAGALAASVFKASPRLAGAAASTLADVATSTASQAVSEALPGEDYPGTTGFEEATERFKSGAINVLGGLAAEGTLGLARAASPTRLLSNRIRKEVVPQTVADVTAGRRVGRSVEDIAKERLALSERTGVKLTIGQTTGSPTMLRVEGMLREMPGVADDMAIADLGRASNYMAFAEKTMKATSGGNVGAWQATRRVASGYENAVDVLFNIREKNAKRLYGEIRELSNKERVVDTTKIKELMSSVVSEARLAEAPPPGSEGITNYLEHKLSTLSDKMSIEGIQALLSSWGKVARGKTAGGITSTITDESITTGKRMVGAIQESLDDFIASTNPKSELGSKLRLAASQYAKDSERVTLTKNALLEKALALSQPGVLSEENLAKHFLSANTTPRQIAHAMAVLKNDKKAVMSIRGAILGDIMHKAKLATPDVDMPIDSGVFGKALRANEEKLKVLYVWDKEGWQNIQDLIKLSSILKTAPGTGGSQTAPKQWMRKTFDAFTMARWNPTAVYGEVAQYLTGKNMVRITNDPQKLKVFLQIIDPPPGAASKTVQGIIRASARLKVLMEKPDYMDMEGPENE